MLDTDETDASKFTTAQNLKLQKNFRAALRNNYKKKTFLKLARENRYEAGAFKSADMDDKDTDGNMKKKLDEIRKQYGKKEKPKAGQYRQRPKKGKYPSQQYQGYHLAGPMNMLILQGQVPMFG